MNMARHQGPMSEIRHNLSALGRNWGWFVLLGVVLILLGGFALSAIVVATFATALAIGVMLIVSGAAEVIGSFWSRSWSGVFLHLLFGILAVVVGVLFLRAPVNAVLALTLLMACLLLAAGLFTIVTSVGYRFSGWGLRLLSGIVDLVLGILILFGWPETALWVLGLYLGISLFFRGIIWITLGLAVRSFRDTGEGKEPLA